MIKRIFFYISTIVFLSSLYSCCNNVQNISKSSKEQDNQKLQQNITINQKQNINIKNIQNKNIIIPEDKNNLIKKEKLDNSFNKKRLDIKQNSIKDKITNDIVVSNGIKESSVNNNNLNNKNPDIYEDEYVRYYSMK